MNINVNCTKIIKDLINVNIAIDNKATLNQVFYKKVIYSIYITLAFDFDLIFAAYLSL